MPKPSAHCGGGTSKTPSRGERRKQRARGPEARATWSSPATTAAYHRDLAQYLTWCAGRGLDPLHARRADADEYATALAERYAP